MLRRLALLLVGLISGVALAAQPLWSSVNREWFKFTPTGLVAVRDGVRSPASQLLPDPLLPDGTRLGVERRITDPYEDTEPGDLGRWVARNSAGRIVGFGELSGWNPTYWYAPEWLFQTDRGPCIQDRLKGFYDFYQLVCFGPSVAQQWVKPLRLGENRIDAVSADGKLLYGDWNLLRLSDLWTPTKDAVSLPNPKLTYKLGRFTLPEVTPRPLYVAAPRPGKEQQYSYYKYVLASLPWGAVICERADYRWADCTLITVDLQGQQVAGLEGGGAIYSHFRTNPSGTLGAFAESYLHVWNLKTGKQVIRQSLVNGPAGDTRYLDDGKYHAQDVFFSQDNQTVTVVLGAYQAGRGWQLRGRVYSVKTGAFLREER